MIFSNIFYFFSVLIIISSVSVKNGSVNFPINIMWIIVLVILFINFNKNSFRRLRRKYDECEVKSTMKNSFNRALNKNMFLALLVFSLSVIAFDLKFLLLQIPIIKEVGFLTDLLLMGHFLFLLSIIWYWSFKYFNDIYSLGLSAKDNIMSNIRFNLAIIIPWVVIIVLSDIISFLHISFFQNMNYGVFGELGIMIFYLFIFLIITPFLITKLWESDSLEDDDIKTMILDYCLSQTVKFKGLLSWNALNKGMITAAVIGVVYPFRYLLLTPKLMGLLNKDEILAVVSHEVGHIKKKHIFLYIMFFIMAIPTLSLFALYLVRMFQVTEPFRTLFILLYEPNGIFVSVLKDLITIFLLIVYFRFFFGYLMRNFERQADIYCFESGINPNHLITSFEKLNTVINEPDDSKNWHHFSIYERVQFLNKCIKEPNLVTKHNKKVKNAVIIMGLIVILAFSFSFTFIYNNTFISKKEELELNLAIVKKMIEKKPNDYGLYASYGMLNYMAENWEETIIAFKNSLLINKNQPDVLNNLAWLLLKCKNKLFINKAEALKYAKRAFSLIDENKISDFTHIIDTLAEAYYQNKLYEQALRFSKRAKELSRDKKEYYEKQYEKMKRASLQNIGFTETI